jgi:transcriptional repressor NrdR
VRCPYCEALDDRVVDSRLADGGAAVRRRRECRRCGRRFTTYERAEAGLPWVRKRSGAREPFDVAKLRAGIAAATAGRVASTEAVDRVARAVEDEVLAFGPEVPSETIGRVVLEHLRALDPVAYLRFASVYKGFEDVADFEREVHELQKTTAPKQRRPRRGADPEAATRPGG